MTTTGNGRNGGTSYGGTSYGADNGPAVVEWDSDIVNNDVKGYDVGDVWNYDTGWEHIDDYGYGEPAEDWMERVTEQRLRDVDKLTSLVGSYATLYFDGLDVANAHIFTIRAHASPDGGNVSVYTELLEVTDIVRSLCAPRSGEERWEFIKRLNRVCFGKDYGFHCDGLKTIAPAEKWDGWRS